MTKVAYDLEAINRNLVKSTETNLNFKLSNDEKELLREASAKAGMTMSKYARLALLKSIFETDKNK